MKKTATLLFVILLTINVSAQLADITVRDMNKNRVSLNDFKGEKLTILDFWATWCKPCVSAIPKLNAIYGDFAQQGVELIGINVDGPRNQAKVKPFAKSLSINYPIVLDPDQELVNTYYVSAFPTLIVINSKGKEVFVHEGFNPGDEQVIREELKKLLQQ